MRLIFIVLLFFMCVPSFATVYPQTSKSNLQTYTRDTVSLNGDWKIIVDPYENGFYNYRYKPFDQQQNPPVSAFFTDSKMTTSSELIEYDFDKADTLSIPITWNTQGVGFVEVIFN